MEKSLLLTAGLVVLCAGLAGLAVAEWGLVPGFSEQMSPNARIAVGAPGIILCLAGAVMVIRTGRRSPRRQGAALYRFYDADAPRAGDNFQNFNITEENRNPIQYMWADPVAGSRICPKIDSNGKFIRVEFLNAPDSLPCSIGIRSLNAAPLLNSPRRPCLQFQARVPTSEPKLTRPTSPSYGKSHETPAGAPQRSRRVALTVRVVNGLLQQWVWQGRDQTSGRWFVEGHSWKTFRMPLHQGWTRCANEGNLGGPSKPDFKMLTAVVFEIGEETASPSGAYGLIDIRDIVLTE